MCGCVVGAPVSASSGALCPSQKVAETAESGGTAEFSQVL
jgi:hypothetical protein